MGFGPDKSKSLTCLAGQGFLYIYGMALSHEVTDMTGCCHLSVVNDG